MTTEQTKKVLEEIAKQQEGVLRPEDIVAAARAPKHPLHDRFEWLDSVAAHAHRLEQARTLIRSVRVETVTRTRTIETVYYVRDPSAKAGEGGYISLPRLQTDRELAVAALTQEFGRALAILQRARDLATALGIEKSVDDLVVNLQRIAEKVPSLQM